MELIQITGFFLGDGFWLDKRAAFSNTNEDLINHYAKTISKIEFRYKLYRRKKPGNRKDEFTLVADKGLSEKIKLELKNMKTKIKNKENSISFLKGIFDAEGTISFASTRRGREIKITNTDKDIIHLVERCLELLKIESRTKREKREGKKECFYVKTYGKSSIKFLNTVRPYKIWSKGYLQGKVNPSYLHLFYNSACRT